MLTPKLADITALFRCCGPRSDASPAHQTWPAHMLVGGIDGCNSKIEPAAQAVYLLQVGAKYEMKVNNPGIQPAQPASQLDVIKNESKEFNDHVGAKLRGKSNS